MDWADGETCELQVQVESDPVTVPAYLQLTVIVWTRLVDTHRNWIHTCGTAPVMGQLPRFFFYESIKLTTHERPVLRPCTSAGASIFKQASHAEPGTGAIAGRTRGSLPTLQRCMGKLPSAGGCAAAMPSCRGWQALSNDRRRPVCFTA